MSVRPEYDVIIVGGGFYGCCLALFLRSVTDRILIIEQHEELLTRASRVNQARVHFGFHYPRSFVTALRSRDLSTKFVRDFKNAVVDDFQMLYAIARRQSKVSTARFLRMFQDMDAPIVEASAPDTALFNNDLVEGVFKCTEYAFDWSILRDNLKKRLDASGITIAYGETAEKVTMADGVNYLHLASGRVVNCRELFNVTYGGLNRLPMASGFAPLPLKYELAEVALVAPPPELAGKAVTIMDGPFFSLMPYPAEGLYSLTHVRYTPHRSWVDQSGKANTYGQADTMVERTRWRHMMADARRYLPCAEHITYHKSLFDVKTVLTRNERDDGRPILLHQHSAKPGFYSVMGGKIDNIYDLFDTIAQIIPDYKNANTDYLLRPEQQD
ncbi:FAD-dependent oxidoreductase [Acetobacter sp. LMG 32666]|uniref:FAD-dependent oxidoreductase n=1 Tax=Acetobacter sp. LMG 32666 TaxID=2959295 RepID=UPI0030C7B242